jgi:hypothetical protein
MTSEQEDIARGSLEIEQQYKAKWLMNEREELLGSLKIEQQYRKQCV